MYTNLTNRIHAVTATLPLFCQRLAGKATGAVKPAIVAATMAGLAASGGCTTQTETRQDTGKQPVKPHTTRPSFFPVDGHVPPMADRKPETTEQVGRVRTDPYAWLKDGNWQTVMQDPSVLRADIRAYLEAENAYTKTVLEEPLADLQADLFAEMRARIKEDDQSLPDIDGPYAYLVRYRTGGEYPVFARKPAQDIHDEGAADTILLDGDAMGTGKAYFAFGAVGHSPDHKLMAYAFDDQGSERYTIRFRDIASGEDLPDTIDATAGDFVWSANSDAIYWVERDDNGRPAAIHRYTLGNAGISSEIYREEDPGFFTGVDKSHSGDYVFITANTHTTSEVRFFPADSDAPQPQLIAARETGHEYGVEHWGGDFVITTNTGGAVDFKLVTTPVNRPGKDNWQDLIPHRPGTLVLSVAAVENHLIRLERHEGLPRLIVRDKAGNEHTIAFDEAAYDLDMSTGYAYKTGSIRIIYSSPSTPEQVYDYDLARRERILRKQQEVPSGHDRNDYKVVRIMAPARDGETIPVTILHHKDTVIDGTAPLLLYGYGSYGHTISARFRTTPLALANRGMIYAIVHPRGSMAKGYQWYLDGKREKKTNTFNDYIDAGRFLVEQGYGAEGRVVGLGGSAGGLLMGAAVNQDPELFAGVIAAVPFVDVLNTMSDGDLPLTPPEWPEWGNPLTSSADYDIILAYSPYDQTTNRPYPPILITGGLSDPRVTYWEPAKWAAKLRHEAPDAGPYFLRINMDAGHGGASGRFEGLKETALEYAFALASVGKAGQKKPEPHSPAHTARD